MLKGVLASVLLFSNSMWLHSSALAAPQEASTRLAVVADKDGLAYVEDRDVRRLYSHDGKVHTDLKPITPGANGMIVPVFIENVPGLELYLEVGDTFTWVDSKGRPYNGTITFDRRNPCYKSGKPRTWQSPSPCKVFGSAHGSAKTYTYKLTDGKDPKIVVHASTGKQFNAQ